ncbi:hypothetical protein FB567DRAFT_527962 [Paraphoma chrysanthemicola]|uniref:Ecp2 effector protein domain-containing protein n=1 Tax=Paraphoma chrysanthemicola TaxID=798071 RepID=A0A8K0R5V4_9PLEO|nr:hypothetical protein FB567DRAFT_527962 [Paraphoma chrysanthemicola]
MLLSSLPIVTLLALATSVTAAPTTSGTVFTISQWIEDIIADPTAPHLTPEEAVAAKNAAVANSNPLSIRTPRCMDEFDSWGRANANDAAACLRYLADKGAQGINCGIGQNQFDIQMCRIGNAQVHSSKSTSSAQGANCNDVARTGGKIFDTCWRSDGTIKGAELCITNNQFQVGILAP